MHAYYACIYSQDQCDIPAQSCIVWMIWPSLVATASIAADCKALAFCRAHIPELMPSTLTALGIGLLHMMRNIVWVIELLGAGAVRRPHCPPL